jgi:hypothetical protein
MEVDMIDKFIVGAFYTRQQIHDVVGGELQTYLPTSNKEVVAGCFTPRYNPRLPYKILIGDAPKVVEKAKNLVSRKNIIPVFKKIAVNKWECLGYFRAVKYVDDMSELQSYADEALRDDVIGLVELEKVE